MLRTRRCEYDLGAGRSLAVGRTSNVCVVSNDLMPARDKGLAIAVLGAAVGAQAVLRLVMALTTNKLDTLGLVLEPLGVALGLVLVVLGIRLRRTR